MSASLRQPDREKERWEEPEKSERARERERKRERGGGGADRQTDRQRDRRRGHTEIVKHRSHRATEAERQSQRRIAGRVKKLPS